MSPRSLFMALLVLTAMTGCTHSGDSPPSPAPLKEKPKPEDFTELRKKLSELKLRLDHDQALIDDFKRAQ